MLKRSLREHRAFLLLFAVFLGVFFWFLNLTGSIGHDYLYFFPRLLDGKWHFLRQGIQPFWYTPHFCGGMPEYGNPQSLFYTPLQFLVLFMDLWVSTQMVIVAAMVAGYAGWYLFGRDIIKLPRHWAHLLAMIILAHGFYFIHMVPGHIIYHPMPLVGLLLWFIFERSPINKKSLVKNTAIFALLTAYILHNGGFVVAITGITAFLLFLPIEISLHRHRLRAIAIRSVAFGSGALLIMASKLVAIWSVMRFFPREMPFERFPEDVSIIKYITTAFWAFPQSESLFEPFGMPDWGALHEYSMFVSPVILVGLLCGCVLLWKNKASLKSHRTLSLMLCAYGLLLVAFCIQLTRGYGWAVTPLESLPILRSLRYTIRFLYPFSLLPIVLSVWCLMRWTQGISALRSKELIVAWAASAITVVAFFGAYLPYMAVNSPPRTIKYETILSQINTNEGYMFLLVNQNFDLRGKGHAGFVPLFFGGSQLYCHEPLFFGGGKVKLPDLAAGKVKVVTDDSFNLYNPACLQYPEANNCSPGDRISVDDLDNFEHFRRGLKTTWKVSGLQSFSNKVSLITFIVCLGIFIPWRKILRACSRFLSSCFS